MSFDGSEGSSISLNAASALTEEFRERYPNKTKGFFVGKGQINALLDQTDCQGIRVYFGVHAKNGDFEIVMVGADSNENDITELVVDNASPCPLICGEPNALNGN